MAKFPNLQPADLYAMTNEELKTTLRQEQDSDEKHGGLATAIVVILHYRGIPYTERMAKYL